MENSSEMILICELLLKVDQKITITDQRLKKGIL